MTREGLPSNVTPLPPPGTSWEQRRRDAEQAAQDQQNQPTETPPGSQPVVVGEQPGGRGEEQTVFDRVAELERRVAEFEAKQERQRQLSNARVRRWRENHPELARQRTREAMRDYRARKKQEGS